MDSRSSFESLQINGEEQIPQHLKDAAAKQVVRYMTEENGVTTTTTIAHVSQIERLTDEEKRQLAKSGQLRPDEKEKLGINPESGQQRSDEEEKLDTNPEYLTDEEINDTINEIKTRTDLKDGQKQNAIQKLEEMRGVTRDEIEKEAAANTKSKPFFKFKTKVIAVILLAVVIGGFAVACTPYIHNNTAAQQQTSQTQAEINNDDWTQPDALPGGTGLDSDHPDGKKGGRAWLGENGLVDPIGGDETIDGNPKTTNGIVMVDISHKNPNGGLDNEDPNGPNTGSSSEAIEGDPPFDLSREAMIDLFNGNLGLTPESKHQALKELVKGVHIPDSETLNRFGTGNELMNIVLHCMEQQTGRKFDAGELIGCWNDPNKPDPTLVINNRLADEATLAEYFFGKPLEELTDAEHLSMIQFVDQTDPQIVGFVLGQNYNELKDMSNEERTRFVLEHPEQARQMLDVIYDSASRDQLQAYSDAHPEDLEAKAAIDGGYDGTAKITETDRAGMVAFINSLGNDAGNTTNRILQNGDGYLDRLQDGALRQMTVETNDRKVYQIETWVPQPDGSMNHVFMYRAGTCLNLEYVVIINKKPTPSTAGDETEGSATSEITDSDTAGEITPSDTAGEITPSDTAGEITPSNTVGETSGGKDPKAEKKNMGNKYTDQQGLDVNVTPETDKEQDQQNIGEEERKKAEEAKRNAEEAERQKIAEEEAKKKADEQAKIEADKKAQEERAKADREAAEEQKRREEERKKAAEEQKKAEEKQKKADEEQNNNIDDRDNPNKDAKDWDNHEFDLNPQDQQQ